MKSFSFQPTLSWRALDNLSFGAGVMLATGSFDLSRALLTGQNMIDMNIPGIGSEMANLNMVSAKLHGKSNVRVGFNVGVLWDINEQWSLGASYRSRMDMHAKKGTAQLEYINSQVENLIGVLVAAGKFPPIDKGTFEGKLPLPSNLSIGVKYSPTERLLFALDAQMVGWSAYDKLVLQFSEEVLDNYSITAIKDYKNTMIVRLGAQYGLTERLDLRAGVYFDQSPVKEMNYNPETPGMNKIGTSIGASFRPLERLSIDLSLLYIAGLSRDGSYTYKTIVGTETTFSGRYASSAFCPTIGLSFDF